MDTVSLKDIMLALHVQSERPESNTYRDRRKHLGLNGIERGSFFPAERKRTAKNARFDFVRALIAGFLHAISMRRWALTCFEHIMKF